MDIDILNQVEMIKSAINNIDKDYYHLKTIDGNKVRERVFCYELYHQFRILSGDKNPFRFNGEPDKRGNSQFRTNHQRNPDFIFHVPGKMENNTYVIEVKGKYLNSEVLKDFKTIDIFITHYNYKIGLFIIYNYSLDRFSSLINENKKDFINIKNKKKIKVLCKKSASAPIEESTLFNIL